MPDNQQVASDQTSIVSADAARRPAVIETASATTSPDNANSGAKPVVIAAVGVVVLLLLANALGGFVAGVTRFALMDELGRHADTLELGDPDGAYGDSDDSDDSDAARRPARTHAHSEARTPAPDPTQGGDTHEQG